MILTPYFLKRGLLSKAVQAANHSHTFRSMKEVRSILVLYDEKDSEVVEPCLETLRLMHKQLSTCVYTKRKDASNPNPDASCLQVCEKELSWLSYPAKVLCKQFEALEADLLIDLTREGNYVMRYLMLLHPSTFKVGPQRSEAEFYDLAILMKPKGDLTYLFGQILFYLQSMHSK